MKLTLDLHVHSDASFDGRMSVRQIALLAKAILYSNCVSAD